MSLKNGIGLFSMAILLGLPVPAFAQEAVVTGALTDSTGAVLPGVTIVATNQTSPSRRGQYNWASE